MSTTFIFRLPLTLGRMGDGDGNAGAALVLSSVPDEKTGREIAKALVHERIAACAHLAPAGLSIYRWQEKVVAERESLLVVKTTAGRIADVLARLAELHPYEVPEALAFPCPDGNQSYLKWLAECCTKK